jgi:uncharacterized protein YkwD
VRNSATRLLLPIFALALLAAGCAMPLPPADLTATAEGQLPPTPEARRIGSEVQSASSGAPSNSSVALQQTVGDDEPRSALAPLEEDELAGTTVSDEAAGEETPAVKGTPQPTETPTPEGPSRTPEPTVDPATFTTGFLELLNQYRVEKGIPPLQWDDSLAAAAGGYAEYMGTNGFFGHYPPTGSTPAGRIAGAGFTGQYQGEALSAGQDTPAVALSRLLGSSAHAAILLNPNSALVGVGYHYEPGSKYGSYWVVVTANP